MLDALIWYLLAILAGAAAFPLAFRVFPALADRGYTVSRALGLLLWGYLFWILSTLGVLVNTPGGVLAALAVRLRFGCRRAVPELRTAPGARRAWGAAHRPGPRRRRRTAGHAPD